MPLQFTENLRYLVWEKASNARDTWPGLVMTWIGCNRARARELIWGKGKPVDEDELEALANASGREVLMIADHRLLQPPEILRWNIDYLFAGLDHGSKGEFARAIGVDVSTISRWRRGVAKPSRAHITKLCEQFALDVGTDLESQPLFLSPTPVSLSQRRDWLKRRIEHLSPQELNELFPALRLLLGGDHAAD